MLIARQRTKAFTIIELLLVIAIIGVMASLGVTLYEKGLQKRKIEQTALQLKQLVQASMTYYAYNDKWPHENTEQQDYCKTTPTDPFCSSYIPLYKRQDPWGGRYYWKKDPKGNLFDIYTDSYRSSIAQRIRAKLPNATVTAAKQVLVAVPAPGRRSGSFGGFFGGMGTIPGSQFTHPETDGRYWACITDYHCPLGTIPTVFGGINSINAYLYPAYRRIWGITVSSGTNGNNQAERCGPNDKGLKLWLRALFSVQAEAHANITVTYAVKCIPKPIE